MHWLHGGAFVVALFTGLSLYLPFMEDLIGARFVVRVTHIAAGLCLLVLPFVAARLGNWRSVRRDFQEAQFWDEDDRRWFASRLSDDDPPVGRFNAGQKANMMFTVAATVFFVVSGVIMWQYFRFDAEVVKNAGFLHDSLTVAILIVWLGHLWYALVNPRTRHSMRGMAGGRVERAWAERMHPKWVRDIEG